MAHFLALPRPGRHHGAAALALALALAFFLSLTPVRAASCPPAPAIQAEFKPLPRTAARVAADGSLRIVTLGSSSTSGVGASSPDMNYPHRLEGELAQRLPGLAIEVINHGVNGQLAADMVERLYRDAIAGEADLVIWQTGTNDALSRVELDTFREQLERGAQWLGEAGIDLILVDPQFFPGVPNQASYERYVTVMQEVADSHGALLFPRYAIMRHWATSQPAEAVLSDDRFHMNDLGYVCMAESLAATILRAITHEGGTFPPR